MNDLARHKESVHQPEGIKYRCTEGPCITRQKNWPRADNFKQHLKRIHGLPIQSDMNLERYEIRPAADRHDVVVSGEPGQVQDVPHVADPSSSLTRVTHHPVLDVFDPRAWA